MICNAIQAEKDGYDGFAVGHFQEPGLYEARASVDIPVHGLGEASCSMPASWAKRWYCDDQSSLYPLGSTIRLVSMAFANG